jgi:two-component system CheB/CheR fusion protein
MKVQPVARKIAECGLGRHPGGRAIPNNSYPTTRSHSLGGFRMRSAVCYTVFSAAMPKDQGNPKCPIAAIGSSAGGIKALSDFFKAVPADSGLAYVVIQHLDPNRHSMLAELLNRLSTVQVTEVRDDPEIKPNRVYVISPNATLTMRDGHLHAERPAEARGRRMPIDAFFRSMANECCERGIGIIMSGFGTDGTLGIKEIKAAGGMVMVQDPEEAEQEGMPRSAIATGMVDRILPAGKMPAELTAFARHPYVQSPADAEAPTPNIVPAFEKVLALLREQKNYDFRAYKTGTLIRRIQRRMSLNHLERADEYVRLLKHSSNEVDVLFADMFIGVTSFFREPESWQALAKDVLPNVVRSCMKDDRMVRVWVPGCSTGEEAYTVAMLVREEIRSAHADIGFQVFGSDVDKVSLERAREGVYPDSIAQDVPAHLMARYFTEVEGDHQYRVSKSLREHIVFAHQNLLADPPFFKLDLICCRNLLIYLLPQHHRDVLTLFHFALLPDGNLFLSPAETVGRHDDLFKIVSQRWRIFQRVGGHHAADMTVPIIHMARRKATQPPPHHKPQLQHAHGDTTHATLHLPININRKATQPAATQRFAEWARQILVTRFAPTCVLIDREGQVLYFAGATHDYLVQPIGLPTRDVVAMAREGLGPKLHAAIEQAQQSRGPIAVDDAMARRGRDFVPVKFVVTPLAGGDGSEDRVLIAFEDRVMPEQHPAGPASERHIEQLQIELNIARTELSAMIQRLDDSHEDQRASQEELMSMNEELQSTNEELETSREELQSVNEELTTVNHQVQHKVEELEKANDDLNNLLASTDIATLFLNTQFEVMRFTPAMRRLLNLLPTDVGRPITDFAHQVLGQDMIETAKKVLNDRNPADGEVQSPSGDWYLRRILAYVRDDLEVGGVVITFTNITERKKTEEHQKTLIAELDHRVKNTLATVSTLASQSLRNAKSLEEFSQAFEGRIQSLSQAHMLMTETKWKGANLPDIVHATIDPYAMDRSKAVHIEGPPLTVPPRMAVTLMMVLHELSTNAAKYGAFSDSKGRVEVSWRLETSTPGVPRQQLTFHWQEKDGPPVEAVMTSGFGTRFIQRAVEYELGGSTSMQFLPYGLRCDIHLPWDHATRLKSEHS